MYLKVPGLLICAVYLFITAGCATFRSDLGGEFAGEAVRNDEAEKARVLFVFSHIKQSTGFDVIPKLEGPNEKISDFEDIFGDALNELSNIKSYATFTNYASDVNEPDRRALKDSLISQNDYILDIRILRKNSFAKHFLAQFFSVLSLTTLPMPYAWSYSITVDVYLSPDNVMKSYKRNVSLTRWVQTFLVFLQPFHFERRKKEEIYIEFFHDIFRQIETEKVLVKEISASR
ncbi:hypothetical protein ACFL6I_01730 [candidate division KSB1 bacterium]